MTAFGMAEQGVGLFLGFGKCLESQQATDRNARHHPGWGPDHSTVESKMFISSEWKPLSGSLVITHTELFVPCDEVKHVACGSI